MTKHEKIKALRFWLGTGVGFLLLILLDSLVASGLTRFLTQFPLSELHRQTLVWLRAPLAILGSQILFSVLEPWILRFRFPSVAETISESDIKLFRIPKEKWNSAVLTSSRKAVWISDEVREKLDDSDLKFLLNWHAVGLDRHHFGKTVLFSALLMGTLLFPYLLLVQMVPYFLPGHWIIPAWVGLYALLFVLNSFLQKKIQNSQCFERTDSAASRLNFSGDQIAELEKKLILLKTKNESWTVPSFLNPKYFKSLVVNRSFRFTGIRQLGLMVSTLGLTFLFIKISLWPVYELRTAAAEGDLAKVKMLIESGTNSNQVDFLSNGRTPLLSAVETGKVSVASYLLEKGSDPNHFNAIGFSPLLVAADRGNLELTQLLLSHGAKANFHGFKSYTPLMVAAAHGHLTTVEALLAAKADINAKSRLGSTALLLAIQGGKIPVIDFLIKAGADLSIKDNDGDDAMILAKRKKITLGNTTK